MPVGNNVGWAQQQKRSHTVMGAMTAGDGATTDSSASLRKPPDACWGRAGMLALKEATS